MQRLLPYTPQRDAYRLLGVSSTATAEEIAAACRRLSRTFHPDRNGSPRATEEMQVVNVVRTVLTDPGARAEYDGARRRWHTAASAPSESRLFAWPTGPSGPGRMSPARRYGRAAWLATRTMLASLAPPRCRGCRAVIARVDGYCAVCGTPLLTG